MKPKMIIKDGKPFITDGEIGGSKFIVKTQPSERAIKALYALYIESIPEELRRGGQIKKK